MTEISRRAVIAAGGAMMASPAAAQSAAPVPERQVEALSAAKAPVVPG